VFGLDPSFGMLAVPLIAFCSGFGWSSFGILVASRVKSIDSFSYVTSMVITPLMLFAGSFFPISALPRGVEIAVNFNPLYHCVQLVRDFVFGTLELDNDLFHAAVILGFAVVMWRLACHYMGKKLVD
jgi:lipooligosaccharide transport system permease protein